MFKNEPDGLFCLDVQVDKAAGADEESASAILSKGKINDCLLRRCLLSKVLKDLNSLKSAIFHQPQFRGITHQFSTKRNDERICVERWLMQGVSRNEMLTAVSAADMDAYREDGEYALKGSGVSPIQIVQLAFVIKGLRKRPKAPKVSLTMAFSRQGFELHELSVQYFLSQPVCNLLAPFTKNVLQSGCSVETVRGVTESQQSFDIPDKEEAVLMISRLCLHFQTHGYHARDVAIVTLSPSAAVATQTLIEKLRQVGCAHTVWSVKILGSTFCKILILLVGSGARGSYLAAALRRDIVQCTVSEGLQALTRAARMFSTRPMKAKGLPVQLFFCRACSTLELSFVSNREMILVQKCSKVGDACSYAVLRCAAATCAYKFATVEITQTFATSLVRNIFAVVNTPVLTGALSAALSGAWSTSLRNCLTVPTLLRFLVTSGNQVMYQCLVPRQPADTVRTSTSAECQLPQP
ncbi:uncharacterized protein [Dermacentor albipictus]|uniref:uncharacterized protein n=1 Tax=Dermacentor albipictus TaxID=60249 RepID=UPI0038FBE852